jgi:hypothetical protein
MGSRFAVLKLIHPMLGCRRTSSGSLTHYSFDFSVMCGYAALTYCGYLGPMVRLSILTNCGIIYLNVIYREELWPLLL